jgi:hypothetical protein
MVTVHTVFGAASTADDPAAAKHTSKVAKLLKGDRGKAVGRGMGQCFTRRAGQGSVM